MNELKVAVITGTSTGFGNALAKSLETDGFFVVCLSRSFSDKDEKNEKGMTKKFKADVTKKEDVKRVAFWIEENLNRVDVLVNNAGALIIKPLLETSVYEWEEIISINLTGVFIVTKYLLPLLMKSKTALLLNIASNKGLEPDKQLAAYCSSKSGLIMLTRVVSEEYKNNGLKALAICPPPMYTNMTPSNFKDSLKSSLSSPKKIAEDVCHIIKNADLWHSGQTIVWNSSYNNIVPCCDLHDHLNVRSTGKCQ